MMENLPTPLLGGAIFLFGLIIGSFLNVVIYRVPRRESVVFTGSHCTACGADIKPYDNIPVVSYLLLGGRCRGCRTRISPIYPIVELSVGSLYLLWAAKAGFVPSLTLLANLVFVSLMVPIIFIDLRHKLILNVITFPGIAVLLVLRTIAPDPWMIGWVAHVPVVEAWPVWASSLIASAAGALVGGGVLWLVREAYFRVKNVEGMGLGDVKLMVMVGVFVGWQLSLLTIFIGSLMGSLIGIWMIVSRRGTMKMEIPFGVFLGPAAIIALFVGQSLIEWYLGMYR